MRHIESQWPWWWGCDGLERSLIHTGILRYTMLARGVRSSAHAITRVLKFGDIASIRRFSSPSSRSLVISFHFCSPVRFSIPMSQSRMPVDPFLSMGLTSSRSISSMLSLQQSHPPVSIISDLRLPLSICASLRFSLVDSSPSSFSSPISNPPATKMVDDDFSIPVCASLCHLFPLGSRLSYFPVSIHCSSETTRSYSPSVWITICSFQRKYLGCGVLSRTRGEPELRLQSCFSFPPVISPSFIPSFLYSTLPELSILPVALGCFPPHHRCLERQSRCCSPASEGWCRSEC